MSVTDYKEANLYTLLKLGFTGDRSACLELSARYEKGTFDHDTRLSSYWQQKANGIEPKMEDQLHALEVYKSRFSQGMFSKETFLQMAGSNSVLVCLSLSRIYRIEGNNEEGKKWHDRAISLTSPQESSIGNRL